MVKGVWLAMATGFVIETGMPALDEMVSREGMVSMLETVLLILGAMAFGGIMEYTGMLARLIRPLVQRANSDKTRRMKKRRKRCASTGFRGKEQIRLPIRMLFRPDGETLRV